MAKHLIKNFSTLATSKARKDALAILEVGLQAIDTKKIISQSIKLVGTKLTIHGHVWDLKKFHHVYVIGIGKASADAGLALEKILGDRITDGIVLDVKKVPLKRMKSIAGTHPFPSMINMRATGEIMAILKHLESDDLIISIISGGGSALLCWPYELKCGQLELITKALMHNGVTIQEMNTVRKHLSEVQGGQFARLAYPSTVVGLIFSDVPGDDIGVVASGPTVMDMTTSNDAEKIMERYDLLKTCRLPNCDLLETPKDPVYFQRVTNILMGSNASALAAMEQEAKRQGYAVRLYTSELTGEAQEVGRLLAGLPQAHEVVLAGGETTVTVKGKGKGGRNQEVVLGALMHLPKDTLVISCASDGIDNSPAAGAIADDLTQAVMKRRKLDPKKALAKNDSFPFFERTKAHIQTGITGANVSDLFIALRM